MAIDKNQVIRKLTVINNIDILLDELKKCKTILNDKGYSFEVNTNKEIQNIIDNLELNKRKTNKELFEYISRNINSGFSDEGVE